MENENRLLEQAHDNSGWDELTDVDYSGDAIETFQVPDTDIPPAAEFSEPPISDSSTDVLKPILDVEESSNQPEKDHNETMVDLPDKRREIHAVDFDTEKYKEDKEKLEKKLKGELFSRTSRMRFAGIEISAQFHRQNHELADPMSKYFRNLDESMVENGGKTLEAFLGYVDAMYPAPFEEKKDQEAINQLKNEYRNSIAYNNTYDSIKGISGVLRQDPSLKDMNISTGIDNIAGLSADAGVPNAFIKYIEEPTDENLEALKFKYNSHDAGIDKMLNTIEGILKESKTKLGGSLAEPVNYIKETMDSSSKEEFTSMMDYIKFKIDSSEPRTESTLPTSEDEPSGPLSKPVIF